MLPLLAPLGGGVGLPTGRGRPAGGRRGLVRARRVRSARRRQPVLSRIRSRCELTVRMQMYSCAAISASVRPWATRVTSSRSRALSFPGPAAAGRRRIRGGQHQGVLGRGGQAHRRAALSGGAGLVRARRLPGRAQCVLPAAHFRVRVTSPACRPTFIEAQAVIASAGRPVAAHRQPQRRRTFILRTESSLQRDLAASRKCAAALPVRPACRSRFAITGSTALGIQIARVPSLGERAGADLFGGGPVPRLGQHLGQQVAAHPVGRAGNVRDLPRLPGQLHGLVQVTGI